MDGWSRDDRGSKVDAQLPKCKIFNLTGSRSYSKMVKSNRLSKRQGKETIVRVGLNRPDTGETHKQSMEPRGEVKLTLSRGKTRLSK